MLYNFFMAVYFFYGEEDFNIDLEVEKFSSKLNSDYKSMSLKCLDNPNYADLIEALRTQPMMFGNMLIIIDFAEYFISKKKTFDDSELNNIVEALNSCPEMLDIIFIAKIPKDEGKKIDTRRKLYKILSKFNSKEFQPIKSYKTAEIASWIISNSKSKGLLLNKDAIELLIEYMGNNLRDLDSEINKLKLVAYPQNIVTKQMVADNCVSNQDLFNFTDCIMKNNKTKALLEFKKLLDKKHPLEILSAVQTMLRKWILLKLKAGNISSIELSKLTGMHEFVIKQTLNTLKNTNVSELVKLKETLFDVEYKLKSAESVDIVSEVERAIIK